MAASDILSLKNPMATRLIRCLYIAAMILIAAMVVLGVARGVRIMSFTPRPMPAAAAPPPPGVVQAMPPQTGMPPRPYDRMGMRRRFGRRGMMGAPFGLSRNPVLAGLFTIFFTLLHGVLILAVVRILAEIGLTILAMPRRSEA